MIGDDPADRDNTIRWHAVTTHEHYESTVQAWVLRKIAECTTVGMDPKQTEEARSQARAECSVWAEVRSWRDRSIAEYEAMKTADAAENQRPEGEHENLVGSSADAQWYERNKAAAL